MSKELDHEFYGDQMTEQTAHKRKSRIYPLELAILIKQSVIFIKENHGLWAIPGFLTHAFIEDISGYILVGALKDAIPPVPPKLPLVIREATPADAPMFRNIIPLYRIRRFVKKMEAGERCAVGLLDNEVIYFAWASFAGQDTSIESPVELGPKDVYFWGAYCNPEYRRFGVSISVSSYHEDLMRQLGYETGYRIIKFNNYPPQNLCKKLGLRVIGRGYGVHVLKWRIYHKVLYHDQ